MLLQEGSIMWVGPNKVISYFDFGSAASGLTLSHHNIHSNILCSLFFLLLRLIDSSCVAEPFLSLSCRDLLLWSSP